MLRSEGLDPGALGFAFRPLWQLDAASAAAIALQKAQATQIYAGLGLWPAAVTARLVEAQLVQDGTYPSAAVVFAEERAMASAGASPTLDYDPSEPRDRRGRWRRNGTAAAGTTGAPASGGDGTGHDQPGTLAWLLNLLNPVGAAQAQTIPPEEQTRRLTEPAGLAEPQPGEVMRVQRFDAAWKALEEINPQSRAFQFLREPGALPSEAEIAQLEGAVRDEYIKRTCDFLFPDGKPIGQEGTAPTIRLLPGGIQAAQKDYDYLSSGGTNVPFDKGSMVRLPYGAGTITLRPITSTPSSPAVGLTVPDLDDYKIHY